MVQEAEKTLELNEQAISRSVIQEPPNLEPTRALADFGSILIWIQGQADAFVPWGPRYKERDKQLRLFLTEENIFASALGIVCSRNSAFSWHLNGPPRTLTRWQSILEAADRGRGWESLITKTTIDLSTQDAGAFWEIVRDGPLPSSTIIGINHLDSARCYHTGIPETPVIYLDRYGKYHYLKWFEVIPFAEMPSSVEGLYGVQYCALTRFLRSMQEGRSIAIRDYERTTGRTARKFHLLSGITTKQFQDAVNTAKAAADSSGLIRYMDPIVAGSVDPKATVGHVEVDLTDPPEGYKRDEYFKEYIGKLAMAFMTDYQEFSPLPGGNLGTSTQSEVLDMKNKGKGAGLFRKMITRAINYLILPQNVEFAFDDTDYAVATAEANVKKTRAQTRLIRINAGEITPQVARQIANDEGDLRQEYLALMGEQDATDNLMVEDSSPAATQIDQQIQAGELPGQPAPAVPGQTSASQGFGERARKILDGR